MLQVEFTKHARLMLIERQIKEEWVERCIMYPEKSSKENDEMTHYYKEIEEAQNRVLHVVVNSLTFPPKIVTLFFDRRFGKKRVKI